MTTTTRGLMMAFVLMVMVAAQSALAQGYSITGTSAQTIDFATFDGSGLDASPMMGQLDSDHWRIEGLSDGDTMFGDTGLNSGDYAKGTTTGGVFSGGLYAFDIGGGDMAFGVQPTGSDFTPGTIVLRITNNTGSALTSLDLSYDFVVFNNEDRGNTWTFAHSSDDTNWTDVGALDETTTETAAGTPMWASTTKSTTISFGSPLADGSHYYLRWSSDDALGGGSRDEYGLNDIVLTASTAAASPDITSISPTTGSTAGGTSVTITGTALSNITSVTFDGNAATNVSVASATSVTCDTPAGNVGMVDVVVSDGTDSDTLMNGYTYVAPLPTITSISPTTGSTAGGTSVTITGTTLSNVTSVTFGGNAATNVSVVSATSVTCDTPTGNAGMVDVVISDGTDSDTLMNAFTYVTPMPTITSISPMSGTESGGTSVTITGTDLSGVTSVTFDGNAATNVSVVSATSITCNTPAGTGTVDVAISDGTNGDTLSGAYMYTTPAPALTAINPTMGGESGGTSVTITGTDLSGVTSVTFGGTVATNLSVVDATTITCDTPAGTGVVDVVASDGTNDAMLTNGFTYVMDPPMISTISPASGTTAGGTTVTITGTGLSAVTEVTFDGTAGTSLNVVSATELSVVTPANTMTGAVTVAITDGTNTDMRASGFTYFDPTTSSDDDDDDACAIAQSGSGSKAWLWLSLAMLGVALVAAPRRRA